MKKKNMKEQSIQLRGEVREILNNYDLEMKVVRKVPKTYYSNEGTIKSIK
jgi:hypothetical protein